MPPTDILYTSAVAVYTPSSASLSPMAFPFAVSGYNKRDERDDAEAPDGRLWANGDRDYTLQDSDYNYYSANGGYGNITDPPTVSFPVKDTDSFDKNTQVWPTAGRRSGGSIGSQAGNGTYWTAIPGNATNGYLFDFGGSSNPVSTWATFDRGFSIRCVRI
jgi:hypothetical protein